MKILYSQKKYYLVVTLYKKIFSKWPGALAAGGTSSATEQAPISKAPVAKAPGVGFAPAGGTSSATEQAPISKAPVAKAPGPLGTGPLDTRGFTLKVQYLKVQA
jgi:hypothetical protein